MCLTTFDFLLSLDEIYITPLDTEVTQDFYRDVLCTSGVRGDWAALEAQLLHSRWNISWPRLVSFAPKLFVVFYPSQIQVSCLLGREEVENGQKKLEVKWKSDYRMWAFLVWKVVFGNSEARRTKLAFLLVCRWCEAADVHGKHQQHGTFTNRCAQFDSSFRKILIFPNSYADADMKSKSSSHKWLVLFHVLTCSECVHTSSYEGQWNN